MQTAKNPIIAHPNQKGISVSDSVMKMGTMTIVSLESIVAEIHQAQLTLQLFQFFQNIAHILFAIIGSPFSDSRQLYIKFPLFLFRKTVDAHIVTSISLMNRRPSSQV